MGTSVSVGVGDGGVGAVPLLISRCPREDLEPNDCLDGFGRLGLEVLLVKSSKSVAKPYNVEWNE